MTSTSSPATGSCPPAAWTPSSAGCATTEGEMASADPDTHERAMRRYPRLEERVPGGRRLRRRERGGVDRVQPGAARAGARAAAAARCPAVSAGGSSCPGSCSLDRRDATLLLDEPTNHLDADSIVWLRDYLRLVQGRAGGHQPRRRPARAHGQPGVPPRRQPGRARHLQRRLEGLPPAAGDRRAAPQARARQRREAGLGAQGAGRPDALQGDQGTRGAEHGQAGRQAAVRAWRRCAATTRSPSCASRSRRRAARRR